MSTFFAGNERYRVIRQLGEGGMGLVFEVEDLERGERVALKTIRSSDAEQLYRLKQEFRALAELDDPNLISFFELVATDEHCFFTMELVDGVDFISYVAASPADATADCELASCAAAEMSATEPPPAPGDPENTLSPRPPGIVFNAATPPTTWPVCDEWKLRASLAQLSRGLSTLHAAGMVHRDVKPSNIMVTGDGRVVLLDFGLVAELDNRSREPTRLAPGTAKYMAPEQCRGVPPTTASDWYSVGAVLYEALTGQPLFTGSATAIMLDKQRVVPPAPHTLVTGVPSDLDELCTALLSINPEVRPSAHEVLNRLGVSSDQHPALARPSLRALSPLFTGRERELGFLHQNFSLGDGTHPRAVLVSGASGIGKSALIHEYLELLVADHPRAVILKSRCYEQESVPFQAIDSMIDDLSRFWRKLPADEASALVPGAAAAMRRVFPVLGRVPAVADREPSMPFTDPQVIRSRATSGLRETLRRVADSRTLVWVLDDMQWADQTTLKLLSDLLQPPDPPRAFIIAATRTEGRESMLACFRSADLVSFELLLEALPPSAAEDLARRLMGAKHRNLAETVAREGMGNPLFINELAYHAQGVDSDTLPALQLEELLARRIIALTEGARRVLELIALAGPHLNLDTLRLASAVSHAQLAKVLRILRAKKLVRTVGDRRRQRLEPFHDRIRDVTLSCLSADSRRTHHRALAVACEGTAPAEQLAYHWYGAGESVRASRYAERAAADSLTRYDFERAANYFRMALVLGSHPRDKRQSLTVALAESLAQAGRPAEAAEAFILAASDAEAAEDLELRRRSAEELLRGGYPEEGLRRMQTVLNTLGFRLAKSPGRAVVSLLANRMRLRVRGLAWRERSVDEIAPRVLMNIDTCWSVSAGLGAIDPLRGAAYQARHLRLALDAGERSRIVRALAAETAYLAVHHSPRARILSALSKRLAEEVGSPYLQGLALIAHAFVAYYIDNRWRPALYLFESALNQFQSRAGTWEVDTAMLWCVFSQLYLGQLAEVARVIPGYAENAEARGDRFMSVNVRARANLIWLVRDDVDRALRELDHAASSWVPVEHGFHLQHFFILSSFCEIALYRGRPLEAAARMARELPALERAQMGRVALAKLELLMLHTRIALALASQRQRHHERSSLAEARRLIRHIDRIKLPLARAISPAFKAAAAKLEGDLGRTHRLLTLASARLTELDTMLYAHAVNRRLGQLVGGDKGAALLSSADRWMHEEGVRNPQRLTESLIPGI